MYVHADEYDMAGAEGEGDPLAALKPIGEPEFPARRLK